MAATAGPDIMVETPTVGSFDHNSDGHVARPAPLTSTGPPSPLTMPQLSPRAALPLPNPPFVFPARPSSSSASSAPSSFSRATGRRPRSAIDSGDMSFGSQPSIGTRPPKSPALPDFSFNPGAALGPAPSENTFLSPPQSPSSPMSIPTRPTGHGHRRGGSEFVGGKIRNGDTITVMSTSPTKSESGIASPVLAPSKPQGRRGHAHRRSAAISSHDLSSIILPSPTVNAGMRGSSAPNSPAVFDRLELPPFPATMAVPVSPELTPPAVPQTVTVAEFSAAETETAVIELQQPPKPSRNRVGFSDTLEFIPRPLSMVSSDTSSTVTARPGHSVSGSISSIISASNTDRDLNSPLGPSPARKADDPRPSTAGAILERTGTSDELEQAATSPRRRSSIPDLASLPSPTSILCSPASPSPIRTPKKWSFFGLEPFAAASSPTRSRPVSASSSESATKPGASITPSAECATEVPPQEVQDEASESKPTGRKRNKKQKKVKTWAGSILSRKGKTRHAKQKRRESTTAPEAEEEDEEVEVEDECVEMAAEPEPAMPTVMVTESLSDGNEESWNNPRPVSIPDDETPYPMIDLDAALGPFNTPLPRNPEWEAAQRAGGLVKKQLHSAAGMTRFMGPGMHYQHRRAESAPEMVPIDAGRFGIHRFGSSSTMADVFEEDEEEDSADKTAEKQPQDDQLSEKPDSLAVPSEAGDERPESGHSSSLKSPTASDYSLSSIGVKRKGSDLSEEKSQASARMKSEHSASSLHDKVIAEESADLMMPGLNPGFSFADDAVNHSPRQTLRNKDLAPVDVSPLHLPTASLAPISPYSMTQSSSFPSPRSPMSYDAHRISTAPSSITEDNFHSLLMGEPGPEVRISVDDIPSLTSSNSTMTRESAFAHNPQARHPPLADQPRPASFTSTAFGRRRSSLASLSRLISSSHGERSKLSMEVSLDTEPPTKAKASKAKRLSRMIQFWKPKSAAEA